MENESLNSEARKETIGREAGQREEEVTTRQSRPKVERERGRERERGKEGHYDASTPATEHLYSPDSPISASSHYWCTSIIIYKYKTIKYDQAPIGTSKEKPYKTRDSIF